jgi:hypothetical protein
VRAELCPGGVAYDCKDLATGSCSGSVGGRTCTVIDNVILLLSSIQRLVHIKHALVYLLLIARPCCLMVNNVLRRQMVVVQVYIIINLIFKGATKCSNFNNKDACKTFLGVPCVWNDDLGSCDNSSCKDITSPDSCMQTSIDGRPC